MAGSSESECREKRTDGGEDLEGEDGTQDRPERLLARLVTDPTGEPDHQSRCAKRGKADEGALGHAAPSGNGITLVLYKKKGAERVDEKKRRKDDRPQDDHVRGNSDRWQGAGIVAVSLTLMVLAAGSRAGQLSAARLFGKTGEGGAPGPATGWR